MADPKPLSRDQLAKFLPDAEAIKRFERLFVVAGDLTPTDVATLYRLTQEASTDASIADSKANEALGALNRIADSLELITMAGPVATPQAEDQFLTALVLPQEDNPLPPSTQDSIGTLSDAIISTPVAGQLLIYDATLNAWVNAVLTPGSNITITNADGSVTVNAASAAVETHAATSKATPVDADELPLSDSASSFSLKKLTWANLKATLATWIASGTISGSFTSLVSPSFRGNSTGITEFTDSSALTGIYAAGATAGFGLANSVPVYVNGAKVGHFTAAGLNAPTVKATSAAGFVSSDGSTGYTGTVTTALLVGKTITIKDGIITGFA